mgnify:CR=1 FL=1
MRTVPGKFFVIVESNESLTLFFHQPQLRLTSLLICDHLQGPGCLEARFGVVCDDLAAASDGYRCVGLLDYVFLEVAGGGQIKSLDRQFAND